jgi:TPR repeat protein
VHTKSFLRVTQWALDTAFPCEAGNPRGLNGGAVFRAGRVAFEARAGDVAACWFQISSAQGELRADVYLGVMYYFGIGVEQNLAVGLERLKKAADGKDPFGMLYLANLFRWGIGIKPNQQLGYSMMKEMWQLPHGPEVFRRVQGIHGVNFFSEKMQKAIAGAERCAKTRRHSQVQSHGGKPLRRRHLRSRGRYVLSND